MELKETNNMNYKRLKDNIRRMLRIIDSEFQIAAYYNKEIDFDIIKIKKESE